MGPPDIKFSPRGIGWKPPQVRCSHTLHELHVTLKPADPAAHPRTLPATITPRCNLTAGNCIRRSAKVPGRRVMGAHSGSLTGHQSLVGSAARCVSSRHSTHARHIPGIASVDDEATRKRHELRDGPPRTACFLHASVER